MKIIGLTGSIAAGKSTIVGWVNELGIASHGADLAVHELLGPDGGAVQDVLAEFGSHFGNVGDGIDRRLLGDEVFASPQKRLALESILHPMVLQHRDEFIAEQRIANAAAIVLEVHFYLKLEGRRFVIM